jgi:hypothetical protein
MIVLGIFLVLIFILSLVSRRLKKTSILALDNALGHNTFLPRAMESN